MTHSEPRNWRLEAEVDGYHAKVEAGPRAHSGGFVLTMYQRNRGSEEIALRLYGHAEKDGTLVMEMCAGSLPLEVTGRGYCVRSER